MPIVICPIKPLQYEKDITTRSAGLWPKWRRMRDLSLCLIEATVPSIREPDFPSRNAALCAQIKQAIVERRDALVESSAH
jgi:hypothetical protein